MQVTIKKWNGGREICVFVGLDAIKKASFWMAAHSCGDVKNCTYFLKRNGSYTASPYVATVQKKVKQA